MSEKDKKKEKTDLKPTKKISQERAQALERALIASRLLEEEFFEDISNSVKNNDKALFEATCKKAKISPEMIEQLWNIVSVSYKQRIKTKKLMAAEAAETPPW